MRREQFFNFFDYTYGLDAIFVLFYLKIGDFAIFLATLGSISSLFAQNKFWDQVTVLK